MSDFWGRLILFSRTTENGILQKLKKSVKRLKTLTYNIELTT